MKKLALPLLLAMTFAFILAGCQNKTTVPEAATKTESQIESYVQQVNQLYVDDAHKKPASLTANKKATIIKAAKTLDSKITPNLYMSGIHSSSKKSFESAQKDLAKVTGDTPAAESSSKESTKTPAKATKSTVKTSAFFDKEGIVKSDAVIGQESDYTGHPKKLANYNEAKTQLEAIATVNNLFTDANHTTIPATLTTNDFPYAQSMVNKASHKAFKTKYLALIANAKTQFDTYNTNNTTTTTTDTTAQTTDATGGTADTTGTTDTTGTAVADTTQTDTTDTAATTQTGTGTQ